LTDVDDSQQTAMIALPPSPQTVDLSVGDSVRLTRLHESVPAGAEGRVVGFYRVEPPRTLVAFDGGPCTVPSSQLERIAS
jgi:hypothetical protein